MKRTALGLALFAAGMFATIAMAEKDAKEVTGVIKADDQTMALKLARTKDLPAIEAADRVKITPAGKAAVDVKDAGKLKAVRAALTVDGTPPSGGETQWTLAFYKGDELVRQVWVYADGEWGVQRPGTSWTCGKDGALPRAIEEALKK